MQFLLSMLAFQRLVLIYGHQRPRKEKLKQSYNTLKIIAPRGGLWYITLLDGFIVEWGWVGGIYSVGNVVDPFGKFVL